MIKTPSPSYSIIIRLEIVSKPGMLGKVTSTIGRAGGDIGALDIILSDLRRTSPPETSL